MIGVLAIREDDLTGEPTLALLRLHLAGMAADSPPDSVNAFDLSGLAAPGVTVWSAWRDGDIAGIGALRDHDDGTGEIKSMRTHPDHLRTGVAAALLDQIVATAIARGFTRLSLETGSGAAFDPAVALYRRNGFVEGAPFGDYAATAFNRFYHRDLRPGPRPAAGAA